MSNLQIIKHSNGLMVDSREVAEMTGKRHDHLLRDIDGYVEVLAKSTAPNFGVSDFFVPSTYQDSTGRTLPCYLLTRKGCDMVANKMTGEKGVLFTATYVTKFEEMENSLRITIKDSYMITDPIERAKAWIVEAEEKKALQLQIQNDQPFANFGKSIANSSDSITIGEFAKVCNNKGIKIGRNRLFDWLRVNGYLIKQGREMNNPKQVYVEQKLFELKEAVIHTVTEDLIRTTTLLTGKGQLYLLDKLSHLG